MPPHTGIIALRRAGIAPEINRVSLGTVLTRG